MANFVKQGRKIVAIGRNYRDHATELGNAIPTAPFFFLKPTTSYIQQGQAIEIPPGASVHHEVELGLVIGKAGRHITPEAAFSHIAGYVLALDMTARNLQNEAKKAGLPWTAAKGYDTFCPVGKYIPASALANPQNVRLWLKGVAPGMQVNNVVRQDGNTSDMMFKIPELVASVSSVMTLEAGDVILTGTPSGVGEVKAGDVITAGVGQLDEIKFAVVAAASRPSVSKL